MDPTLDQLLERLEALEKRQLQLNDLPIKALYARIEQDFRPEGDAFLLPKSVGESSLEDGAVNARVLASDSVTTAEVVDATLLDTDLASPNNAVYRTLLEGSGPIGAGAGVNTYGLAGAGTSTIPTGTNVAFPLKLIHLAAADFAVDDKTTQLRVKGSIATNATAPTRTWTLGLSPVSAVAGAAGGVTYTIGAHVTGSTSVANPPPASTRTAMLGNDFTFPADGFYCLSLILTGGSTAANSFGMVDAQLLTRHT